MNDGGPAFPVSCGTGPLSANFVSPGMSLRDWFAGMALQGFLHAHGPPNVHLPTAKDAAYWAFEYADAMLEERLEEK